MTESHSGFRSLAAWQKSQDLGVRVIEGLRKLPREQGAASLSGQLVRSVGSVSANIAEGYGRYSEGAYRNHCP
jgi:four helix bundle protein